MAAERRPSVSTELKKFRRYQVVMASYNIIGESPPSLPMEVSVGEAGRRGFRKGVMSSLGVFSGVIQFKRPHSTADEAAAYVVCRRALLFITCEMSCEMLWWCRGFGKCMKCKTWSRSP